MREIKFRGKMLDSDDWVCGYYIHSELPNEMFEHKIYCADVNRLADVKEDTVGQYTGLKDRNGIEIYEGDIIKTNCGRQFLVKWTTRLASFCYAKIYKDNNGNKYLSQELQAGSYEVEIIGNLYENPELLEIQN